MSDKSKVTTLEPFCETDTAPLFSVNAGVPIEEALELSATLMLYVERLAGAEAFVDKALESGLIQYLSEMARALNNACQVGAKEEGVVNA